MPLSKSINFKRQNKYSFYDNKKVNNLTVVNGLTNDTVDQQNNFLH